TCAYLQILKTGKSDGIIQPKPELLPALDVDAHLDAIRADIDPAVAIGTQQGVTTQRFQHFGVRQAIHIASGNVDDDQLRVQVLNDIGRIAGSVTRIREQEQIHFADGIAKLQRLEGVIADANGQKRAETSILDQQNAATRTDSLHLDEGAFT